MIIADEHSFVNTNVRFFEKIFGIFIHCNILYMAVKYDNYMLDGDEKFF